jgi:hypothetical protein
MRDFVMDKSGAGADFLRELRFSLPIYIPSASPQSSSLSPEAGTIGQEWPQCQLSHKPNKDKYNAVSWFQVQVLFFRNCLYRVISETAFQTIL